MAKYIVLIAKLFMPFREKVYGDTRGNAHAVKAGYVSINANPAVSDWQLARKTWQLLAMTSNAVPGEYRS